MIMLKTKDEINSWLSNEIGIKKYTIHENLIVDIHSDFNIKNYNLTHMPVQFGLVEGHFWCGGNFLTNLKGCPKTVLGGFYCNQNQLVSLEGGPEFIGGNFHCYDNKLSSLEGGAQFINGDFLCGNNLLTSLKGAPRIVDGKFDCGDNLLTSLEGSPQTVNGTFDCRSNQLKSLRGCPQYMDEHFWCLDNLITSLKIEHLPLIVKGDFSFKQDLKIPELINLYDKEDKIRCTLEKVKKELRTHELKQDLELNLSPKNNNLTKKSKV